MLKHTPERRIDPENRMGFNWHKARALRRFENIPANERRTAISDSQTKFREDTMRALLLVDLDRIESAHTPEQQKLLDFLLSQCEHAASVWTEHYVLKKAPSKDKLIAAAKKWLQNLSADVLQGFVELCPETAELTINPPVPVEVLMGLIDAHKTIPGQTDGKIWSPDLWKGVKPNTWTVSITDGAEDLPFDESIFYLNPEDSEDKRQERTSEQMVAEYERRFNEKGLLIMPQHGYVPSAAVRIAKGQVLDRKFWTAFKKPASAGLLPGADWRADHVRLDVAAPGGSAGVLRCRPWAEGEIKF